MTHLRQGSGGQAHVGYRITTGTPDTTIGPAEFARRMRAIPPGAADAPQRALMIVVETLLSIGYADGVEALETLLTFHKVAASSPVAEPAPAASVERAIQESGQAP